VIFLSLNLLHPLNSVSNKNDADDDDDDDFFKSFAVKDDSDEECEPTATMPVGPTDEEVSHAVGSSSTGEQLRPYVQCLAPVLRTF
jgi:hypothetical protein